MIKNEDRLSSQESLILKIKRGTNIYRVLYHILGLIFPLGYLWVIKDKLTMSIILLCLFLGFLLADIIRLSIKAINKTITGTLKRFMKEEEAYRFSGSTYFTFACLICVYFFPKMIAITAIIFLCVGDPSASIIGRLFGKVKLFGGKKSLEGSLTMFVVNSVIGYFFVGPLLGVIGALTSTIVELFPFHLITPSHYGWIDDNATIPVISGFVMYLLS